MSTGRGQDVKASFKKIEDIDSEGLWVTAIDAHGQQIEIEISGLTPEVLEEFLKFSFKS